MLISRPFYHVLVYIYTRPYIIIDRAYPEYIPGLPCIYPRPTLSISQAYPAYIPGLPPCISKACIITVYSIPGLHLCSVYIPGLNPYIHGHITVLIQAYTDISALYTYISKVYTDISAAYTYISIYIYTIQYIQGLYGKHSYIQGQPHISKA